MDAELHGCPDEQLLFMWLNPLVRCISGRSSSTLGVIEFDSSHSLFPVEVFLVDFTITLDCPNALVIVGDQFTAKGEYRPNFLGGANV
jgi:hypothetical protein